MSPLLASAPGDVGLPARTLRTSLLVVVWFAVVFWVRGRPSIGLGLVVGGALGLGSLASFVWGVPRLLAPGNPRGPFWLVAIMLVKLIAYALVLNYAMSSKFVNSGAVFAGVGVVPLVIALKMAGQRLMRRTETGD